MKKEKVLKVIYNELECIKRQIPLSCNRECQNCDLLLPDEEIISAYNEVIKILENE